MTGAPPAGSGRLAVVGGHSILGSTFAADATPIAVESGAHQVTIFDAGSHVVLQRHGVERYTPAHLVDHAANLFALRAVGCGRVLALSSVGSLRRDLPVGSVMVPDDFIALAQQPLTLHGDERGHAVPGFHPAWRTRVVDAWAELDGPIVDGGVYWQTTGPRFETPAEVRMMAAFADVVGMTVGSEAVLAGELGIAYAAVCIVDNLANGLAAEPLTVDEFEAGKRATRERVVGALAQVVPELVP